MSEPVLVERRDDVLVITLNRPGARNAVDLALAEALSGAVDRLDADAAVAVGVLTGAGPGFCAGMDLGAFHRTGKVPRTPARGIGGMLERLPRKPLIVAIEGFALAGGLELALACDLIVAGRSAVLGLPEVKRSLVAAGGGLLRLPLRVPFGLAMEMALTGEPIDAERAERAGLVDRVTDDGEALDVALGLARTISANGPLAVTATKELLRGRLTKIEAEYWARQERVAGPVFASNDAREGARAFKERRVPVWSGV
jgi:enoyl-CoA hydratase